MTTSLYEYYEIFYNNLIYWNDYPEPFRIMYRPIDDKFVTGVVVITNGKGDKELALFDDRQITYEEFHTLLYDVFMVILCESKISNLPKTRLKNITKTLI